MAGLVTPCTPLTLSTRGELECLDIEAELSVEGLLVDKYVNLLFTVFSSLVSLLADCTGLVTLQLDVDLLGVQEIG